MIRIFRCCQVPTMKELFVLLFIFLNILASFSQELPLSYPSHVFHFTKIDSSNYGTVYLDQELRDSIRSQYSNSHQAAKAIEEYEIQEQGITFLARSSEENVLWQVELFNGKRDKITTRRYWGVVSDYNFEHYFPDKALVVFRVQLGEGNAYAIFDRKTGKEFRTCGPPVFSPTGKFFVCYNEDTLAGYSCNGIQLYELVNGEAVLRLQYYPKSLGPTRIKWINDSTLNTEFYTLLILGGAPPGGQEVFRHYRIEIEKTIPNSR